MIRKLYTIITVVYLLLLLVSCGEDRTYEYEKLTKHNIWIFEQMNDKYLWAENFKEQTFKDYFAYPQKYFGNLIAKGKNDNGSYVIVDSLNVDKHPRGHFNHIDSYGFDFVLISDPTSATTKSYARVTTVYPNSPAEKAGLQRNDFIEMVDSYKLTSKNTSLLESGPARTFYIKRLQLDEQSGICNWGESLELSVNASTYVEDVPYPCFEIINYKSDIYTAYLMCTRLTETAIEKGTDASDYMDQMDDFFDKISQMHVNNLILDLRLCNFGTMEMARRMASHIVPPSSLNKTFAKTFWNKNNESNNETILFDSGLADMTLDLDQVVILTSDMTQGAAEWLINALNYALGEENVTIIGTTTAGQEFMTQHIADYEDMIHLYPAVAFVGNGDGDYQSYENGIIPDVILDEMNHYELKPYGSMDETLLKKALETIFK